MSKVYEVEVYRTLTQVTTVTVVAEDEDDAQERALDQAYEPNMGEWFTDEIDHAFTVSIECIDEGECPEDDNGFTK